jgi:signal transduction histidine kinase
VRNADELGALAANLNLMNDRLGQLYEQLEMANRHKSQFLANVSHELRTPLNAIIGFTRVVLRRTEGQIADLQRENLRKVLLSGENLLNLINGLLDLSKIEAGRMEIVPESFEVNAVLDAAASTVEPMLAGGRVRLVREVAPGIPPLHTDREKLRQILLNLLSNAAKFTEDGEIRVSAWPKNGSLTLVVSDSGIGMDPEALTYIFEEFRQAGSSGPARHGGTGLGLAITKRLVHVLGGEIAVESERGTGSTFTVTLPMSFDGNRARG